MKRIILSLLAVLLLPCRIFAGGMAERITLLDAIEQSAQQITVDVDQLADRIAAAVPAEKRRVAVVDFDSESDNLSDFIISELSAALFERNIEIVERRALEYVINELRFQLSGAVRDDQILSLGNFMGAELVVTGQLRQMGGPYRLTSTATSVEQAILASVPRFDVPNDRATQRMITAINGQTMRVSAVDYGVTIASMPTTAGGFLDRGILFAMEGDYIRAIADFTRALQINPDFAGAYIMRGRALRASVSDVANVGDDFGWFGIAVPERQPTAEEVQVFERAIADFTHALTLDPDNGKIYLERGLAFRQMENLDAAITDLDQAMQLAPDSGSRAWPLNVRGETYMKKGNLDQAIADFTESIRLFPTNYSTHQNRGNTFLRMGRHDRAMADFTEAIRLDPGNGKLYFDRGHAYSGMNDHDRAIADFSEAIRLDPLFGPAYTSRGIAYAFKHDSYSAVQDLERALEITDERWQHIDMTATRTILYTQRIELIRQSNFYLAAGDAHREVGAFDLAIANYTESIRLAPTLWLSYYYRSFVYFQTGDLDSAIADLESVLRIEPDHGQARRNLEMFRQQRGR